MRTKLESSGELWRQSKTLLYMVAGMLSRIYKLFVACR